MKGEVSKEEDYQKSVEKMAAVCRCFLKEMEEVQERLHLFDPKPAQKRMIERFERALEELEEDLVRLTPLAGRTAFHDTLSEGIEHLQEAYRAFTQQEGMSQLLLRILQGFHHLSLAQYAFYELRQDLKTLGEHWLLEEALPRMDSIETPSPANQRPTGFLHRPAEGKRGEYTLYVPECYDPGRVWPLIVCLHGGMGRGDDYIWTWLRPAKSRGYLLLSPKSIGSTWNLFGEDYDGESVLTMLEEVCQEYRIDRRRVLLTGLSDGGSYAFTLGLNHPESFSGLASIAGVLQTTADLQRAGELPILIVHGLQDYIFPVGMARAAFAHLEQRGFRVTYQELPDWGHAYPYTIHARIVLPWFEGVAT